MPYERLSPQDAMFLHVEDEHQPMHVGALATFDGAPFFGDDGRFRIDDVRRHVADRLHLVPRFRKKVQWVALGQGRPVWVDDADLDLAYHVRLTALPRPGDERQLLALMSRLQGTPLDRRRPLWELWFVEGLEGDRVGLVQKTHHCLIDGISGIDVATVLLDLEPDPPSQPVPAWIPEPPPAAGELLVDSLVERASEPAELVRSLRAAVRTPRQALGSLWDVARQAGELVAQPAPPSPFNVPVGPHRRFEVARVALDPVREIKARSGTTVNDVVLAVCAGGLRRFLRHRGEVLAADEQLRAMVPVSVRSEQERMALGNRVSMMLADLPVGVDDPLAVLAAVHRHTAELKEQGQAASADAIMGLAGYAPATLVGLAARLAVRNRAMNLTITNVPGPQFPLYCMGARMREAFPYVGLLDHMALVIGLISYDGQLGFGITGDRDVLDDLDVLAAGIEVAADELLAAVRALDPPTEPGPDVIDLRDPAPAAVGEVSNDGHGSGAGSRPAGKQAGKKGSTKGAKTKAKAKATAKATAKGKASGKKAKGEGKP